MCVTVHQMQDELKDNTGKEAWNQNGLMQEVSKPFKQAVP